MGEMIGEMAICSHSTHRNQNQAHAGLTERETWANDIKPFKWIDLYSGKMELSLIAEKTSIWQTDQWFITDTLNMRYLFKNSTLDGELEVVHINEKTPMLGV